MKTPSSNNNSLTLTKPNTNSNPMNTTKTSRSSKPSHILVGSIAACVVLAMVALPGASVQAGVVDPWGILNFTTNPYRTGTTPWAVGDKIRYTFVTNGTHNAVSNDIAVYNTWANQEANALGSKVKDKSTEWKVAAGTAEYTDWVYPEGPGSVYVGVTGIDNTAMTLSDGIPVFRLDANTTRISDSSLGFWSSGLLNACNVDQEGTTRNVQAFNGSVSEPGIPNSDVNIHGSYGALGSTGPRLYASTGNTGLTDGDRWSNSGSLLTFPNHFRVVSAVIELDYVTATSIASADWHTSTTWNLVPAAVPTFDTKVIVNSQAVTITSTTADCFKLTLSNSGSVSVTGRILNIASTGTDALNTTGGTLSLDATSTLTIPKANTSAGFAGLTVAAGAILNVTSELTVDSVKDLSGAIINTPKVTFSGGSLVVGTVNLQANTLTAGDATESTFGGALNATTGTVVKQGGGVLNLAPGAVLTLNTLTANDGTLNVNSALGNAVVSVSDAPSGNPTKLRFGSVSQTLSSLTIGAGATVVFTSGVASGAFSGDDKGAGFGGGATVPEPGTIGLLLVGAIGMLSRRRRA